MGRGLSVRMKFEDLRSLAFGSIGAGYSAVGTAVEHPVRFFALTNLTDVALLFSTDGVNDHIVLPANGYLVFDISSNKTQNTGFYLAEGDRMYVKQLGAPSSGSVYFTVAYGV